MDLILGFHFSYITVTFRRMGFLNCVSQISGQLLFMQLDIDVIRLLLVGFG